MKNIILIAGTRPNFIKLAPLYHTLIKQSIFRVYVCHTGQHFDSSMSDVFWKLLRLPLPDFTLSCSGGNSSEIAGKTILALNDVFRENSFDLAIVFGDVNATLAGAIVSSQHKVKLMHVEAGLRSFDRTMPEEINRVLTDHVSDYLMVSEPAGLANLEKEGVENSKVFFVGNIMIETLISTRKEWEHIDVSHLVSDSRPYIVVTFHRPENVDTHQNLSLILEHLNRLSENYTVIFPVHPRTKKMLTEFSQSLEIVNNAVILTEPLDYFTFLKLVSNADAVITDSGGIQEETTYLQVPCITIRNNTERPVTISEGTNLLQSLGEKLLFSNMEKHINAMKGRVTSPIKYWDDQVSNRIALIIQKMLG
jgi:UDP-N-acetylglucosamine 2-epimerase (non-hydrolysing)